ncbi:hypothetical protein KDW_01410 [Dictyobacter vulcani]|uniref:Uncharacterized protein n=1 Tax=Dictyobacter vulcani TaxID=2607529 RepID=A0A5J4KIG8_9CHLR|nr:hypothetical protein KDW_01410 [Dictyobacter vulcani]
MLFCETCRMAVTNARRLRDRQRYGLQDFLTEGETVVPSTTASILIALQDEPHPTLSEAYDMPVYADTPVLSSLKINSLARSRWNTSFFLILTVAAVVVIGSLYIFSHSGVYSPVSQNSSAGQIAGGKNAAIKKNKHRLIKLLKTPGWSAVVMTHPSGDGKNLVVENYDPIQKRSFTLFTSSNTTVVDGVSHEGSNLIYHTYDKELQQTAYNFLSGEQYYFTGRGLNAVWSTDDQAVFLSTDNGALWKINTSQHNIPPIRLPQSIYADQLAFYRNHFLYYVRGYTLCRINVDDSQSIEQQVVFEAASRVFWMDPISEDIYYVKKNATHPDIYKHQSDTAASSDLPMQSNGIPIGYTKDAPNVWTIMYVSWNQMTGGFDIRKTSSTQVLFSNIANGKVQALCDGGTTRGAICDNSLALSPTGHTLLVGGANNAHEYQLWSIDLDTNTRTELENPAGKKPVQLIGWDKFSVN